MFPCAYLFPLCPNSSWWHGIYTLQKPRWESNLKDCLSSLLDWDESVCHVWHGHSDRAQHFPPRLYPELLKYYVSHFYRAQRLTCVVNQCVCVCVCVRAHTSDCVCTCMHVRAQSCPILCNPMDCSPLGSSVHGIFQAKILEQVAKRPSRGSSWPRDRTSVSWISCTGRQILFLCVSLGISQLLRLYRLWYIFIVHIYYIYIYIMFTSP